MTEDDDDEIFVCDEDGEEFVTVEDLERHENERHDNAA